MKKELLNKRIELEVKLEKINNQLNYIILNEDLEKLTNLSIDLDNLKYNPILKKLGTDRNNNNVYDLLYDIIKIVDKSCSELHEEIDALEFEIDNI